MNQTKSIKANRGLRFLSLLFALVMLLSLLPVSALAVSGSTVAADGVYSTSITAYKYKYGKLDKSYYGTLNVAVSDGEIAGLWISNASSDKMSKLITNEVYYTYVGTKASVSAVQSVSGVDGVSSASVSGSTTAVNSSVKKQYVADIQGAIVTALGKAPARSGSDSGSTAAAAKTVQGTASVSDAEGSKLVLDVGLDADGKIVSLTVNDASVSDWSSIVSKNADSYIGKTAGEIDAVTGATQYTAAVNTAVLAALEKAGTTPAAPTIISGNGASYTKQSGEGLTITSSADYSTFQGVTVDGSTIAASNYSVASGSTVVTLKSSYLDTLGTGSHTVGIVSDGGTATAAITVAAASTSGSGSDSSAGTLADGTYTYTQNMKLYSYEYDVTVTVTVADGKFSSVTATPSGSIANKDKYVLDNAVYSLKNSLSGKTATADAISNATFSSSGVPYSAWASSSGTAFNNIKAAAVTAVNSGSSGSGSDSGSDAGKTISPGQSAVIYVGETLKLQGTKPSSSYGNYHYWYTDEEDVDYIEWDINNNASSSYYAGTNIANITGIAAGTVTVYHQYVSGGSWVNPGETFTITVKEKSSSGDTITYESGQTYTVENETFTNKKIVIESGATVIFSNVTFNDCTYDFSKDALVEMAGSFKESATGTGSVTSYGVTLSGNGYTGKVGESFSESLPVGQMITAYTVSNVQASVASDSSWATASVSGTTVTISGTPTKAGTYPLATITMTANGQGFVVPMYIVVTDDGSGSGTGGGTGAGGGQGEDAEPSDPTHVKAISPDGSVAGEYTITLNVTGQSKTTTSTTGGETTTSDYDILLVLDNTRSMITSYGNTTRLAAMKSAAQTFVNGLPASEGSKIAMVSFTIGNGSSPTTTNVSWNSLSSGKSSVLTAINGLTAPDSTYGYDTYFTQPLERASSLLDSVSGDGNKKFVVFFTDGAAAETVSTIQSLAGNVQSKADATFSIGIVSGSSETQKAQALASDSGNYYDVTTAGTMSSAFSSALTTIQSQTTVSKVPMSNVVITDTLSNYVELASDTAENHGVTLTASPADSNVSISKVEVTGKEVKVSLSGSLTDDTVYTVSIPVKPSEAAQAEANANDDPVSGFVSNAGAVLAYQYGSDTAKTAEYSETPKVYVARQVTLTYDANAGEDEDVEVPEEQTAAFADADADTVSFDIPETTPTREGYTFLGWNTDKDADEADDSFKAGSTVNLGANTTLYAVWASNLTVTYRLTSEINPTDAASAPEDNNTYAPNAEVTVKPGLATNEESKDGVHGTWTFSGWTAPEGVTVTDGKFTMPNESVTFTGEWTFTPQYRIILEDYTNGGAATTLADGAYYDSGTTVSIPVTASMATVLAIHTDGSEETLNDQNGTFERLYCNDNHAFSVEITDHDVYVVMAYKGDIDLMGDVDLYDAELADEIYVEMYQTVTNLQKLVADVDGDTYVDLYDAELIDEAYVDLYTMEWDVKS